MGYFFIILIEFPLVYAGVGKHRDALLNPPGLRKTVATTMFRSTHNRHLHIGRDAHCYHALVNFRPQTDAGIKSFLDDTAMEIMTFTP